MNTSLSKRRLVSAIFSDSQDLPDDADISSLTPPLHPKGIPGGRNPNKQDLLKVDQALWALEIIAAGAAKVGARKHLLDGLLKLWPNIWRWLQFLHGHCIMETAVYGAK
jgi:hypothetical protein